MIMEPLSPVRICFFCIQIKTNYHVRGLAIGNDSLHTQKSLLFKTDWVYHTRMLRIVYIWPRWKS
jgi:hypothetical protein